jgi:hypothetical protein
MDRYVDPVNGWSISYPVGWRVDGSNPAFVQIRDPQDQALVGIRVWPTDLPLNAVVDQMLTSEEQYQGQSGVTNVIKGRQMGVLPNGTSFVDVRVERQPGGRSRQIYALRGGEAFGRLGGHLQTIIQRHAAVLRAADAVGHYPASQTSPAGLTFSPARVLPTVRGAQRPFPACRIAPVPDLSH